MYSLELTACASASLNIATALIPISLQVFITRHAISPLLAIKILSNGYIVSKVKLTLHNYGIFSDMVNI